jgi:hypothetical protein
VSLIKKSDVKNHLSPRHRTQIHLCPPESPPDATGFSAAEPDAIKESPEAFSKDFTAEHSSIATPAASDGLLPGSTRAHAAATSISVQL